MPDLLPHTVLFPSNHVTGFSRELYWQHREYNALLGSAAMLAALVVKILWLHEVRVNLIHAAVPRRNSIGSLALFGFGRQRALPLLVRKRPTPAASRNKKQKLARRRTSSLCVPATSFRMARRLHYRGGMALSGPQE